MVASLPIKTIFHTKGHLMPYCAVMQMILQAIQIIITFTVLSDWQASGPAFLFEKNISHSQAENIRISVIC